MRVCIVYDCLYPYTVGGAERWYRNLAERLASGGHDVTFLTRRQWARGEEPDVPGVRIVAVAPRLGLYTRSGRRRILPPLLFGLGVFAHLRRRRYDLVHTASFPYFSLLAARSAQPLFVDWHELWTREYWREYLGPLGWIGWRVQRACLRIPQRAFCFSRLHEQRLRELNVNGSVTRLEGQYTGNAKPPQPARPVVVYAGRHIPEKRVPALVAAMAQIPDLRAEIYGDGPERQRVLDAITQLRLEDRIAAPGFVARDVLDDAMSSALCLVLPSSREGYGLVVIESAARGVPVVVVDGPDNASVELVQEGVNGAIAPSVDELAAAIIRVRDGGAALRDATAEWFRANANRLSFDSSFERVAEAYG